MKNTIPLLSLIVLGLSITSCTSVSVDAGHEAVLVEKPIIFGHGGVDETPISTGQSYAAFTTDYKIFQITPITVTEEFKDMIPSDNTPVSFNAYIKYQIKKGQTPNLYKNFGENWYDNSIKETFRTMVRDEASQYKMFDLASKREVSEKIQNELLTQLSDYSKKINLPVDMVSVVIGAITPPDQVLTETKNTAAQNQSILTQAARAQAELARKQAEINKADADRAYQDEMRMTIAEYLQLRQLEIEKEKVEMVKDHPNVSVIFGGGIQPVVNAR